MERVLIAKAQLLRQGFEGLGMGNLGPAGCKRRAKTFGASFQLRHGGDGVCWFYPILMDSC